NNDGSDVQFDVRTVKIDFAGGIYTFLDAAGAPITTIDVNASNIVYDNTSSGLTALDAQAAIDELVGNITSSEASNGLHIETENPATEGHVKLGGALTQEITAIETDANHTLAITGLQPGNAETDNIMTVDASGVLKTVSSNKFVRFFYMPSITFDTSTNGTGRTKNLHQEYIDQFTPPNLVGSTGAPAAIPNLPNAGDLYYYVTYYDPDVFANLSISVEDRK